MTLTLENPSTILSDVTTNGTSKSDDTDVPAINETPPINRPEMKAVEGKVLVDPKFVIPAAGIEAVPVATLTSIDFNSNGGDAGLFEMTAENSIGSVLVVTAYQAILTALKSESARREGHITRQQQVKLIANTAMESGRSSAFTLVVCAALVSVFPWLTPIFAILGVIGGSAMALRITGEFWNSLDTSQQSELRKAAEAARVNLSKIIPDERETQIPAVAASAA